MWKYSQPSACLHHLCGKIFRKQTTTKILNNVSLQNMAAERQSICEGWPTALNSSLVWDHEQFPNEDAYIHILSADEKTEINAALKAFKGLSLCD
jgi:hypothetical protein